MKKTVSFIMACLFLLGSALCATATDGKVTYDGSAQKFIFEPGSEYSPTDLFPDFKGVMPGDRLTEKITVRNEASNKVKVNIYMRSLGAHEQSSEFLSQLGLKVAKSAENEMAYMFDAAANETAQLTDWVLLGTLYSGGEVDLDVTLTVPLELGNEFSDAIGYLDWEFKVEELPIEEGDPEPPATGDTSDITLWAVIAVSAAGIVTVLLLLIRKKKNKR